MRWERTNRRHSRVALMMGAAATLLWAVPAAAQGKQNFSIPAGDAAASVQRLAIQSGLQVMAPDADLAGITTNRVSGSFTPVEALRRMLAGKGLDVVQNGNVIVIRRAGESGEAPTGTEIVGEEIVVTGSRIERAGFDTLQAATVDDAELIRKRGFLNVAEALESNPLFGTSDSSGVGGNQSVNGTGQRFVDMFSLGSQRTLTLVNGRRFVSANSAAAGGNAPAGSQVDLNLIPAGLVERVETIAIGGAPIYGSDAIAGTVNIILKRDFEGFQISALAGIGEDGASSRYSIKGLAGTNFAGGRANVVAGIEYTKQSGLLYGDRFGGFKSAVPNPANGNATDGIPAQLIVDDYRLPYLTQGGLPYSGPIPHGSYIRDAQGRPLQFGPGGDLVVFNLGEIAQQQAAGPLGIIPTVTKGGDGLSPADYTSLLTPTDRLLANLNAHFDLSDNVRVFFEGAYAHSKVVRLSDLTSISAPGLLGGPRLTLSIDNAFLSDQARSILQANGLTTFNLNRNLNDVVQRIPQQTVQDMFRGVGGIEGNFEVAGERWKWDASFNYGQIRNKSRVTYVDPVRLVAAANAVKTADGRIVCGGAAPAGCVPINLFGFGAPSDEAVAYVTNIGRSRSTNTQTVLTANLGGKLPFGFNSEKIAFNIGAERRTEKAVFDPDAVLRAGNILIGSGNGAFAPVSGKFDTKEAYGELVIPLISNEQDFPLIRNAELDGSVRYVDHSLAGGALTWSAGGRLSPRLGGIGDGLTIRGVYTRAIRSPAINELFLGSSPTTNTIADPCSNANYNRGNNAQVRAQNCALALGAVGAPVPAAFVPTTNGRSVAGTVSGNVNLENEKAKSWSAGFVYQPSVLRGFRLAADWTDIKLSGGIENLAINSLLASCYDSSEFPNNSACGSFRRLTAADIASGNGTGGINRAVGDIANGFSTGFVNTSSLHFAGLIVAADYDIAIDRAGDVAGSVPDLRLGTKIFYTDRYSQTLFPGQPTIEAAGAVNFPKWRVQTNIGTTIGAADIDFQILWRSKTKIDPLKTDEDSLVNNVPAYTLVNGTLGFQVDDRFRIQMIVNNIFDRDVPYAAVSYNRYTGFDILGRSYLVSATASF